MADLIIARIVHVIAVLFWIGGVGIVTLVVFPWVRRTQAPEARLAAFHQIEGRFAPQARLWVALAGLSGGWLLWSSGEWQLFFSLALWWLQPMVAVWLVFALMLFIAEPLALHRRMRESRAPEADFRRMEWAHRALLVLATGALACAVGGSHGLFAG